MNPLNLLKNYRHFKANNRYTYPFLFFAIGALKNLMQFATLGIAGWVVFQLGSGHSVIEPVVENTKQESAAVIVETQQFTGSDAVEVLAAATTNQNLRVAPIVVTDPLELTASDADEIRQVFSWEWILQQDEKKFTIQFASSPDKERLYETANSFPVDASVAVFPFKKTPSNRTVYGFSSGVYDSLEIARLAIAEFPQEVRSNDPWIRPIEQLQKEIVVTLAK